MKEDTSSTQLFDKALSLAKGVTVEELYEKTRLPISWLRKFRDGSIKNPSVNRVEKVIVGLTGKPVIK